MDSKNKNILIGGLLAIVLVMAVGYAAFATQLQINGTANITSSWNVHFALPTGATAGQACTLNTAGTAAGTCGMVVNPGNLYDGTPASTVPTGTITYSNDLLTATIAATLNQPGDTVVYTLTPTNEGTLAAKAGTPTVLVGGGATVTAADDAKQAVVWSNGSATTTVEKITYTVEFSPLASVAGGGNDNPITVTATYASTNQNETVAQQAAVLSVTIQYTQA